MTYKLYLRDKTGALVVIEGYDTATQYFENYGDTIAEVIEEKVINTDDYHRTIR